MQSAQLAQDLVPEAAPGLEKDVGVSPPRSSYIPTLDGWRALAVGLVMGAHCETMLLNQGSAPARLLASLFDHAGYGVDIFFGLSGFLICTLLLREKERTGTISLPRFYLRRVFRILPPMLLYMACILTLSHFQLLPHIARREVFAVLFFYRNYIFAGWYTLHFWSLAVEEHFYAVVPLFLLLFNRKWAMRGALALILTCICVRWLEFSHGPFESSLLQWRTENRFDGLLWGVVLALAMHGDRSREWLRQWLRGPVVAGVFVLAMILLFRFTSQPSRRTIVAALVPVMVGYTVLHARGLAGRFMELPLLKWIGRLSYSLYIWQMMFLTGETRYLGPAQNFPLALILPFVCAALSFYLLEKPMVRIGHQLAASPGAKPDGRYAPSR